MPQLYLNWFDIVIILVLLLFIWQGIKQGFVVQFLMSVGFFGGIFLGGWLFPHILRIHDPTIRAVANGNLVLIFAVFLSIVGYSYGQKIHFAMGKTRPHEIEVGVGVVYSIVVGLVVVWLVASLIGRLPFAGFSNSANDSLIVQVLDNYLPPVPAVFAEFNKQLNPNAPPQTYIKNGFQLQYAQATPSPALQSAATIDQDSVVRIASFGCGGIVTGTGFVVGPQLVMTNAHVLAGVERPIVKYGMQSYVGTPLLFDPNLDLAILKVPHLNVPPLTLRNTLVNNGTQSVLLGYPNGNYTVAPAVVLGETQLETTGIYGIGTVIRAVYELSGNIGPGSSGGPMVMSNGQVAGVVFARPQGAGNYAYVLTSQSVIPRLEQAEHSNRKVSTGVCYGD